MLDLTKESSLLNPVIEYIRGKGYRLNGSELPFYRRNVDVYGFSMKNDKTIAIELKLYKWRKAFQQALIYQLCADEAYIAMPQKSICAVNLDLLLNHGIGLISVDDLGKCKKILNAQQSSVVRGEYKKWKIEYLRGIVNA